MGKGIGTKNDDLSLILGLTQWNKITDFCELSFGIHTCAMGIYVHTQTTHINTHFFPPPLQCIMKKWERTVCTTLVRSWVLLGVISMVLTWRNINLQKWQIHEVMMLIGLHMDLKTRKAHPNNYFIQRPIKNTGYCGVYPNCLLNNIKVSGRQGNKSSSEFVLKKQLFCF